MAAAELALEQARGFAFAVDAAFKQAQKLMCADASKQGECRALKAIREDIWAVEGKIREAKWATDAGDKAFLSKQIEPLMQQVLDKCETHRDQVQTCQELLQDIHSWCEQRGTGAHRVRVEPSAAAKAASARYSGDSAGAGTGTASSRIPGYRSPTKQRAASQQQGSGAADGSSQQASGVKAMAAGFSRIPQPQQPRQQEAKQVPGRRASLPDAQQRPQDTTDQAQASSEAQLPAAATTGQEGLSRHSSSGGSVRGIGGMAATAPGAAASGSASKGPVTGGVGSRVAPRSLLQMEPSRDDVALSSAGQLLQQSSSSGAAAATSAPSLASASAAQASHVTGSLAPTSGGGAAAAAAVAGSPARSLHAQLVTPPGRAVAPAHITRADELAALEAAYGPVDELTQLPPFRGTPAASASSYSLDHMDHGALVQEQLASPGSSQHAVQPPPPYLTSSTAAYQHLHQLHAGHLLGSSAGGGGLTVMGGAGISRTSADVAAMLQRSGLMESALLASTSRVHVVHDAVAHKPTRKPGRGDVPDVPVVPASLAVQHNRRRQPRSLLGRLVRAVAGTVVAAAVTTAGVVAYKEAEENGLLPGKLGQRSGDGRRQQRTRAAAAASDALLFVPMGPAPDASAGCG